MSIFLYNEILKMIITLLKIDLMNAFTSKPSVLQPNSTENEKE